MGVYTETALVTTTISFEVGDDSSTLKINSQEIF